MIDDGNLTSDGESEYAYDSENRLIEIQPIAPQAGDFRVKFAYDYMGRRVRKLTHEWIVPEPPSEDPPGWSAEPVEDRRFIYDGWNVVMERTCDDIQSCTETIKAKYAWGLDLSGLNGAGANVAQASSPVSGAANSALHGAGGIGGLLAMETSSLPSHFDDPPKFLYFYDGNGNVGQLVAFDAGVVSQDPPGAMLPIFVGEPAARYEYDPYGGTLLADDPLALENPFRFSTKYYDTQPATAAAGERGMYYYGYRYFSPRLGRWTNRDPIGEVGGDNLYLFAINSPTMKVDPLGLQLKPDERLDWKVCCRAPRVAGTGGSFVTHCELKQGACDDVEEDEVRGEYDVWLDGSCQRKLDNGKPCCCSSFEDVRACLVRNPYSDKPYGESAGGIECSGGEWGNNCQTSTILQLGKCCLKSNWSPAAYAGDPRQRRSARGHFEQRVEFDGFSRALVWHWVCDEWGWVDLK